MAANGFISGTGRSEPSSARFQSARATKGKMLQAPAVIDNVLKELKGLGADLSIEDLFQGRIQVYSTVDARVQHIVNEALEHGLELYEKRHPRAKGWFRVLSSCWETAMRAFSPRRAAVSSTQTAPRHTATLTASRSPCGNLGPQ